MGLLGLLSSTTATAAAATSTASAVLIRVVSLVGANRHLANLVRDVIHTVLLLVLIMIMLLLFRTAAFVVVVVLAFGAVVDVVIIVGVGVGGRVAVVVVVGRAVVALASGPEGARLVVLQLRLLAFVVVRLITVLLLFVMAVVLVISASSFTTAPPLGMRRFGGLRIVSMIRVVISRVGRGSRIATRGRRLSRR